MVGSSSAGGRIMMALKWLGVAAAVMIGGSMVAGVIVTLRMISASEKMMIRAEKGLPAP